MYLYGVVSEEDTAVGIVADASGIARTVEGALWSFNVYFDRPFCSLPMSSDETLTELTYGAAPTVMYVISGMSDGAEKKYANRTSYTQDHARLFFKIVASVINKIERT